MDMQEGFWKCKLQHYVLEFSKSSLKVEGCLTIETVTVRKLICYINLQRNNETSLTRLLGAFLAFVKAPGGTHSSTAIFLL